MRFFPNRKTAAAPALCWLLRQQWETSPEWIVPESGNRMPTDAHIALSSAAAAGTAERPGDAGLLWALRSAFPEDRLDADFFSALSFSSNFKSLKGDSGVFVGMRKVSFDAEEKNVNDDAKEGAEPELLGGVIVVDYDCTRRKTQAKQWWRFNKIRQLVFNLKLLYHMRKRYGVVDLLEKVEYKSHRTKFFRLISLSNTLSDSVHALYAPTPHWFLKDMSVHPKFQGRGIGKQVLRKLHSIADLYGKTIYLETTGEKNTRFYEAVDYKVMFRAEMRDPDDLTRDPVDGVVMVREPLQTNNPV